MGSSKQQQINRKANEIRYFHKNVIEGKTSAQASEEMGLHKDSGSVYKKSDTYRRLALAYIDDKIGGVEKVMEGLIALLDAEKPHNVPHKTKDKDGKTVVTNEVEWVPDQKSRLKAIQEFNKIYGTYAPQKKDIRIAVSFSSDTELFAEIDEAERVCKYVGSYEEREGSFELAPDPQGTSSGDFKSRKRALLQGTPVQTAD